MHALRYPVARVLHVSRSKVLAGPKYLGFAGGVFNPGSVVTKAGSILVLAKGQHMHWLQALALAPSQFMVGAPVLWKLSDTGARARASVVELRGKSLDGANAEDFRMFRFRDCTLVNHCVTRLNQTGKAFVRQALSRLDETEGSLELLGFPQLDFDVAEREKNWVYLEADGRLLLFYRFSPLRVLQLTDERHLAFSTLMQAEQRGRLADPGGIGALVSFSTNPIPYGAGHVLVVIHQIDHSLGFRRYLHWGVLIDRATLKPSHITANPLFDGLGARGRSLRGVLYVTSAVATQRDVVFFNGEGDSFVTTTRINRQDLDRCWVDVRTA